MTGTTPIEGTYRANPTLTPAIWAAFEIIANDAGAGYQWLEKHREIPPRHAEHVYTYERWLRALSNDDLETFCIGEESDQQRLMSRSGGVAVAAFLTEFWASWEIEVEDPADPPEPIKQRGCAPHFTTEQFSKPCGCREASCLCHIGTEQRAADALIDAFAARLKAKFRHSKAMKGRTGWDEENWSNACWDMMRAHCDKDDPIDVGLLAAFAWNMSPEAAPALAELVVPHPLDREAPDVL